MICEWERPGTMWYPALLGEETVSKALTSMNWNNFELRTRLFVVACILWHCFRSRGRSRRLARIYDLACLSSELASYILFNCFHTMIRIKIEFTSLAFRGQRWQEKFRTQKGFIWGSSAIVTWDLKEQNIFRNRDLFIRNFKSGLQGQDRSSPGFTFLLLDLGTSYGLYWWLGLKNFLFMSKLVRFFLARGISFRWELKCHTVFQHIMHVNKITSSKFH